MRIGVDLDGTVVNLAKPLLKYYNKKHGTSFKEWELVTYNTWECLRITRDDFINEIDAFYASPYFNEIMPMPGAQAGLGWLRKWGDEPHLVTARPPKARDFELKEATNECIKRYFPKAFYSTNFSSDFRTGNGGQGKAAMCKELGLEIIIEDCAEYAQACADAGIGAYLLEQPWNSRYTVKNVERCRDWDDLIRKISEL